MPVTHKPVALITGASSGMGKDMAIRLISAGYTVYGAARRVERMAEIVAAGGKAVSMDVTDDASMIATVDHIVADEGRIDVLVNNAGYGQYGAAEDVPIELGRRQMEVNLIGAARLTQLCLPHMRARKFGKILNITSMGGKFAMPLGSWYHASKFALEGFSDALRNEVRPFGIDVIVIEPGGVESEWSGIAAEEAARHSTTGAYANLVQGFRKALARQRRMSPPSVISDVILTALRARKPKTRYHRGMYSGPLLFLRRWLSDRMFDRLITAMVK
ncbi:MAG TPA: oxidoreductase [Terriglobales bacterium]|nr:oxidoreductase [Terriglobales bacterium]